MRAALRPPWEREVAVQPRQRAGRAPVDLRPEFHRERRRQRDRARARRVVVRRGHAPLARARDHGLGVHPPNGREDVRLDRGPLKRQRLVQCDRLAVQVPEDADRAGDEDQQQQVDRVPARGEPRPRRPGRGRRVGGGPDGRFAHGRCPPQNPRRRGTADRR